MRGVWIGLWLCAALLLAPATAGACDGTVTFRRASFELHPLQGEPPRPPRYPIELLDPREPRARAVEVALPDRLGRRLPNASGVAWYRVTTPRVPAGRVCALLARAHANAVVYVNGEWLGQGGRFTAPAALTWNRPLYLTFASERLGRAVNHIDIGVLAHGGVFNALEAVTLGTHAALQPRHERLAWLRAGAAEASSLLALGIVVLFAAFGLSLREPIYGLLALAAACFGVNSLNFHLRYPPVGIWAFNTTVNVAIDLMGCVLAVLVLRLLDLRSRRAELALAIFAGVVVVAGFALPGPLFERYMLWFHVPVALICLVALSLIFVYGARLAPLERRIYQVTSCLMVLISVHDLWLQYAKQHGAISASVLHWFPLLGPVMLIGFGAALLARFLRVYRRAERANVELEQQIAEKRGELERNFARVRAFEHEAVVGQERERIMGEMHDGIGGHLVATLAMIESGRSEPSEIARALREALDDMRLVIHSLQPSASDIPLMLADMRARLEPRLARQGMRFAWAVRDMPGLQLGPGQVLQVLRIVQESITNVLKHASARRVAVATGIAGEGAEAHAFVEIRDDGCGMDRGKPEGRGLPNMRGRARKLGGDLQVDSSSEGTAVRLSIPLRQP